MLKKLLTGVAGISFLSLSVLQADDGDGSWDCGSGFFVDAEYLYWKLQNSPKVVPLVVEGPVVPFGSPILGVPGTEVVLGGESIHNKWRSGGRFALGYWFDDQHSFGLEADYFFLAKTSKRYTVSSDGAVGSPFLAVPFFDVTTNLESSVALALPGSYSGTATLKDTNRMQGAELNALTTIRSSCNVSFDLLLGFRYWNFVDHLSFDTSTPFVTPPIDIYKTKDKFHVKNNFYGGQIGAKLDYIWDWFFFDLKGKVALGGVCQESSIHGSLFTNDFDGFGTALTYPGGYFALPTNIGNHKHTRFSVIPEANADIGLQFADCFRIKVGYTFLYASNVLWASKQVNRHINPTQSAIIENTATPVLVGPADPKGTLKTHGLWVQGASAGIEFQF